MFTPSFTPQMSAIAKSTEYLLTRPNNPFYANTVFSLFNHLQNDDNARTPYEIYTALHTHMMRLCGTSYTETPDLNASILCTALIELLHTHEFSDLDKRHVNRLSDNATLLDLVFYHDFVMIEHSPHFNEFMHCVRYVNKHIPISKRINDINAIMNTLSYADYVDISFTDHRVIAYYMNAYANRYKLSLATFIDALFTFYSASNFASNASHVIAFNDMTAYNDFVDLYRFVTHHDIEINDNTIPFVIDSFTALTCAQMSST
jgi:hypothetical protein